MLFLMGGEDSQLTHDPLDPTSKPQQFKDHCNSKSNQKNLGTIKSSNLCTEIIEYTAPDEVRRSERSGLCLPGRDVFDVGRPTLEPTN